MGRYKEDPPAVRVYTVCDESRYLVVRDVPALGCGEDLMRLFTTYRAVEECKPMDTEDCEEFTDVYWIKFHLITNARNRTELVCYKTVENDIDHSLLELRTRDMTIIYWQRVASYGSIRILEILQYVAAQSTPRPQPPQFMGNLTEVEDVQISGLCQALNDILDGIAKKGLLVPV